jgi:release factor glutamine methyltransferase
LRIYVYPQVYPPSEDSYLLLDAVRGVGARRVLEIGCGCGLISVALAYNGSEVFAVDINLEACKNTLSNSHKNNLRGLVHVVNGDTASMFRTSVRFDLVVCNPPYIPVNPSPREDVSWAAGECNSFSTRFLKEVLPLLSNKGVAFIVQSNLSHIDAFKKALLEEGFSIEEASRMKLFFEEILVLKISKR